MSTQNFVLDKAPYIRKADNKGYGTAVMMRDFLIALLPLILFAWVKNGLLPYINMDTFSIWDMLRPLLLVIIGAATSYLTELVFYLLRGEKKVFRKLMVSFPAIPGILLAMILPYGTPYWVLVLGAIFGTFFGKLVFGGFGNNIFNPALVGYIFVTTAFTSQILPNYLNPSEYFTAGATPMATLGSDFANGVPTILSDYPLWKIFVGLVPGALAETSALLCLVALVYLLVRKVINWRIPVIYIATVFVLTYVIGAFNGYAADIKYSLTYIFSGALFFGAVFMATEPVTSPRSPNGKVIYALFLGVLTVLFRYRSSMPEGVATSILLMNCFTVIVDRLAAGLRVAANKKKVIVTYAVVGLLVLGIGAYGVSAAVPKEVMEEVTYKEQVQDLDTFDFQYTFTVGEKDVTVITGQDYQIKSVSDATYDTDKYREKFAELIGKHKFSGYIASKTVEGADTILVVKTKRSAGREYVTSTITFTAGQITAFTADTAGEDYNDSDNEGWQEANGHPKDIIPGRIIANQDDLDAVQPVTGATDTSNILIQAARLAIAYMEAQDE